MGLDLTLMPFNRPNAESRYVSTLIECWGSYELFQAVAALEERKGKPVPERFEVRGFDEFVTRTPYGEPLRWVTAGSLVWIAARIIEREESMLARAAWAYLAQLSEDWPVALYWH
jgi:hypothetical protein